MKSIISSGSVCHFSFSDDILQAGKADYKIIK